MSNIGPVSPEKREAVRRLNVQYSMQLIEHEVRGEPVQQRSTDGYINATAMCRIAGKSWGHYRENAGTTAFLTALENDVGIPISVLVKSVIGGAPHTQGTWVHPQVAIHLAQWLSPEFAVKVSKWVYDWLSGTNQQPAYSYHLRRYTTNLQNVPYGHWSMLQELMIGLIGPMEARGYVLPENLLPDISEGRMFCKFLRDEMGVNTDELPTYRHTFEDGRIVWPKAYPNKLLPPFREHFFEIWVPQKAEGYFQKKDPKALEFLPYLLPKPFAV
ncbi:KilA-N domain-containing protein [Mameliella sediminis]|uniref:KilA-N domain-containing protein n=1 Tax=Mameliella sediminis TaxID=2836866 RepID=UPI001C45D8DF|nr:KilA-N domain-containing protein [Mameliella sediminis]MBV7394539.1 KilA-N domain-containing protein [Mameliella sediminis]